MFRTTEDPSSGSLVQCLAKNYKNDSIVSVDMDKFGATHIQVQLPKLNRLCPILQENFIKTLPYYCQSLSQQECQPKIGSDPSLR